MNNTVGPPNVGYSDDDRTASTSANTSSVRTTRVQVSSGKTSGKWYSRVTASGINGPGRSLGLVIQSIPPGPGTAGKNRWSWGATAIASDSPSRTMPRNITTYNGNYELAVDVDANLFWMRAVGDLWNNSGTADPATGVDGLSCVDRGAAALFLLCGLPNTQTPMSWTIIAGTPPSGFTQWS